MKRTALVRSTPLRAKKGLTRERFRKKVAKHQRSPELEAHWNQVRAMGCAVCRSPLNAQLHHCHSREISAMGYGRGVGQKTSDWLVICLCQTHHTGEYGVDAIGVITFEDRYGSQVEFLRRVEAETGVAIFERARDARPVRARANAKTQCGPEGRRIPIAARTDAADAAVGEQLLELARGEEEGQQTTDVAQVCD